MSRDFGIQTLIQPSAIRVFKDADYTKTGAIVQEDLSSCPIVLGVKEMPLSFFHDEAAYAFFSHTIKGQKHNMPMLKQMMSKRCHLIDYEKVCDETGNRILFFGRYAGIAGMHDTLWALGKRLDSENQPNPFSVLKPTYAYGTVKELKSAVSEVGERIAADGLPPALQPFICGFTGYGHVSQGAQEIFNLLPHKTITPEKISSVFAQSDSSSHVVFKSVFEERHLFKPISQGPPFELQDYYDHPEKYESQFEQFIPFLTLIINGIYWTPKYPRIVTVENLKNLFQQHQIPRLRVIGDITCDVNGSIECTVRSTQPDKPVFVYDPRTETDTDGWSGPGIVVLAVDNLPCELPRASSTYFGNALMKFVPSIIQADLSKDFTVCELPPPIKAGTVLYQGKLAPAFTYLQQYL